MQRLETLLLLFRQALPKTGLTLTLFAVDLVIVRRLYLSEPTRTGADVFLNRMLSQPAPSGALNLAQAAIVA
ncbi:hypothetical protein B0T11DRAFT_278511 [Plectosphaerella cucumerina]|uniref:Uncharacterized protein n=1 Tax=Plectosphaerella cucumerina TaxID=40658 RepID=A0A8K0X7D4_9PEZI|nr:hypothetical protein B0T11DRAFT_278511 [Plectosphaerella cucumerina]